uniref:Uncharacterized protein n=1 Tax=Gadus morhua TaxID=8049 RepID=A0A8C5A9N8_GADMO
TKSFYLLSPPAFLFFSYSSRPFDAVSRCLRVSGQVLPMVTGSAVCWGPWESVGKEDAEIGQ